MTKLSYNLQKEKISRIAFEKLIFPWGCSKFEHDIGIDLIVQPYTNEKHLPKNGSLAACEKRFLVQLKSTENENQKVEMKNAKIRIDMEHLLDWRRQHDPVMIARYFINENRFYYNWINQIKLKENQKSQTILLNKLLDEQTKEKSKEAIITYLLPISISNLTFIPSTNNSHYNAGFSTIKNIRNSKQLTDLFSSEFFDDMERQVRTNAGISKTKDILHGNPNDHNTRLLLVKSYIYLKKYNDARQELGLILRYSNNIYAKILFSALSDVGTKVIEKLNDPKFVVYLKWKQETPPGTYVKTFVILDEKKYCLTAYDPKGVILPIQKFKTCEVGFSLMTTDSTKTPTVSTKDIYLMVSLLDESGCLIYKYGEVLKKI